MGLRAAKLVVTLLIHYGPEYTIHFPPLVKNVSFVKALHLVQAVHRERERGEKRYEAKDRAVIEPSMTHRNHSCYCAVVMPWA